MIRLGLGEEDHRGKIQFSSHQLKGHTADIRLVPVDADRGHLAEAASVRSSTEHLPPPRLHCPLRKDITVRSSHVRSGELCSFEDSICTHYLKLFCMGDLFLLFNLCIHSIVYLYKYGHSDISLYTLGYILILPYLFCCSSCF